MVRVLSVHHFLAQDVDHCTKPVASTLADNLLLLANENNEIEVRDLQKMEKIYKLSTIDTVTKLVYSPIGKYLATIENRDGIHFVRVYLNWRNEEALLVQPVRTRIASVTPGSGQTETCFEAVDISCGNNITGLGVCQSTGNLIMARDNNLTIYKYSLATHQQTKSKYIDFQDCMNICLNYSPTEVRLAEDIVACLTKNRVHVFKLKLEVCNTESNLHSLSMYSFSSESDGSMDPSPTKSKSINFSERIILNVTERRRKESSCGKERKHSVIRKHPGHILLEDRTEDDEFYKGVEIISNPLAEKEQKELGSLSSPNILETMIGPCENPPDVSVSVQLVQKMFPDSRIQGTPLTLLMAKISEAELNVERLHLLQLVPVYWREYRVKRNKDNSKSSGGTTVSSGLHNPLQSVMYSHLMSFTFMFTSTFEGYLYHIPGHLRRVGKGVGVKKIGTYPFTSPVREIVLEPSLLHALTDTGLETYTLRSGYHTVREAQAIDNKSNACPPTSTPICLIGLRPFIGVERLCIGESRLVLLSAPEQPSAHHTGVLPAASIALQQSQQTDWTIYSLHLPDCLTLYKDMVSVAEVNSGTPHAHLQLLCEAHMVLRNSLHRLTWLQVMKSSCSLEVTQEQIEAVRAAYKESCCKLADHYVNLEDEKCLLATPYYRMSGLPVLSVLERFKLKSPLQEGVLHYIKELVLAPVMNENIIENGVAEKIITILGDNCVDALVDLLLKSPVLRGFKSQTSLKCLEAELSKPGSDKNVELVVAAILVGASGERLTAVPPIQLSCVLLQRPNLLLDQPQNQSECFSDLSLAVKHNVPALFCELCASLVESNILNLGQMLQLLLQTFMSLDSGASQADNALVLQLFLETYFVELISHTQDIKDLLPLSSDQQQAVTTLLRSYLANLIHSLPASNNIPDDAFCVEPGECFGQRQEFLDVISDNQDNETLLKLESLLCSGICNEDCKDIVLRFLDEHPDLPGELSLMILCTKDARCALDKLFSKNPSTLLPYCKYRREDLDTWSQAVNLLNSQKSQESTDALYNLLEEMVTIFPAETLCEILPRDPQFQETIIQSRRNQRADQLQQLIVTYSIVAKI